MCRTRLFSQLVSAAALLFASCSGPVSTCTSNCGGTGGTATVSLTLVADTLPANPSLLAFKVSLASISLTPATGAAEVFTPPAPIVLDLMRLTSDSAYLGTLQNVPSGTYSVQVSLSGPQLVFFNDTASPILAGGSNCPVSSVCSVTFPTAGSPLVAGFSFTASSGGKQGFGIDFNLSNALSLANGTLAVNFNPASPGPPVLSAFSLPRANANLGANQLDLIEDFTGVVGLNGSNLTITSLARGVLTGSISGAFFDASPAGNLCPPPASPSCVSAGQIGSVDAILGADGTFSIKEFEPLLGTQQDLVEGIVYSVNSATQFGIAVTDKVELAANSLLGSLGTGELLTVNLVALPNPFLVDSKGLAVQASFGSNYGLFANQTSASAIHPGQVVAVHVAGFTAASGTTPAAASADTVILRWSRLRANLVSATSTTATLNGLPSYFGVSSNSQATIQAFLTGALGGDGVTNLEGVANNSSALTANQPVGVRVLYLQNAGNTATPALFAAKIRQP